MTGPFELWLRGLAEEAESRQWPGSRDLITLWERIDDAERLVREWPTVWQRFWDARFVDHLRAAAIALKERRPPSETRGAVHLFRGFAVKCEVVAVSLGDHVAREVIVLSCDGLPMHGSD
ncbi:MAG: hypothetical protein JOZ63_20920 [Planctomycetaceae bacterium]|nr:hypothetical protein [Planctomycetaceae bacterium]